MVKEHAQAEFIPHCTVKDFFEILYADGKAARAYHKLVDKDDNAQVEIWQGNTRTVSFCLSMQLPAVLSKLVGSNSIPVKEIQEAETDEDGVLHITSTPIIGVPGGNLFKAVARLAVKNNSVGGVTGCQVAATVMCHADGPWGMTGMIEGIMIKQSAASVEEYLQFCIQRCSKILSTKDADADLDGTLSPRSDATSFDQFFDAQEGLSRRSSMASSISALSPGVNSMLIADAAALIELIDTMEGRLASLSGDLATLRALIPSSSMPKKQSRLNTWLLAAILGSSLAATVCFLTNRHQSRSG